MPRRSAADAQRTRDALIETACDIASSDGLAGVTIGRLADEVGMSKAGVLGHFGSKEGLQLAAIEAARQRFVDEVSGAVLAAEPGLAGFVALTDAWITHIADDTYPGGCIWATASVEFDNQPGPVRDAVQEALVDWDNALTRQLKRAVANGELPSDTDIAQIVFETRAVGLGLNQELQMHAGEGAERRARKAIRRALGRSDLPIPRRRRAAAAQAA